MIHLNARRKAARWRISPAQAIVPSTACSGMTLETVSRALSKLAREKVIAFAEKGRREVHIPGVGALSAFVQRCLSPVPTLQ